MSAGSGREGAFEKAAETRQLRAEYEALIEDGGADLAAVFTRADADPVIGEMKLLPLLEALPSVGKVLARRALESAGIDERARAASVDPDRRAALDRALLDPENRP